MTTLAPLTEEGTSKFVQTKQWKIHYNEAGTGHPLIFIHGGGAGATGWSNFHQNMQVLHEKYRCIAIDAPGYGQSDPVAPYQNSWSLAVKLLMDELGIEQAALCGNSLGGACTLTFAANYNDRISHIITMGSAPVGGLMFSWPGNGIAGETEGLKALAEAQRNPSVENFRRAFSTMAYDSSFVSEELIQERARIAQARQERQNPPAARPAGSYSAATPVGYTGRTADEPSVLQSLTQVDTPALIIHGRDDRAVMLESSLQIFTALKNSRLLVFNRCGHWAQLEHAEEFNRQVDTFLSNF